MTALKVPGIILREYEHEKRLWYQVGSMNGVPKYKESKDLESIQYIERFWKNNNKYQFSDRAKIHYFKTYFLKKQSYEALKGSDC